MALPVARQYPAAHAVHAVAPAYAYVPTAHAVCEAGVAHALPAAHCTVSLAEPAGQWLPAVVQGRQSPDA